MCGRYSLRATGSRLQAVFRLAAPEWIKPRFNIAPSQPITVMREIHGQREWASLKWGLLPAWSREASPRYSTINARAETVASKPAFREAFERRRCLIPADGFYEWSGSGKQRQPYFIHRSDDAPFAFAGLWERWQRGGQVIESATIIVTAANALMAPIHDRMPVILAPGDCALWLDHCHFEREALQALLKPCSDAALEVYPVSRVVNSPARDEPACVQRQAGLFG